MALASYKYRTLFVHIFKTAGTSIRHAMAGGGNEEILGTHSPVSEVIQHLGEEEYNKFFSFSFIRNPYDWMLSLHNYILIDTNHFLYQEARHLEFNDFIEFYIKYCEINPLNKIYGANKTISQYEFLHVDDVLRVNYLGKQETIEHDLKEIERLGKCCFLPLQRLNITSELPAEEQRKVYNQKGIDLMCKHYEKDFILGGYSMELFTPKEEIIITEQPKLENDAITE